jgi:Mce-associated membrane protein
VSAVAAVPAVAVLTAHPRHAVAMVFVDQTTIIGSDAPTATSSVVKVTLDRVDDQWLVSGFDPM